MTGVYRRPPRPRSRHTIASGATVATANAVWTLLRRPSAFFQTAKGQTQNRTRGIAGSVQAPTVPGSILSRAHGSSALLQTQRRRTPKRANGLAGTIQAPPVSVPLASFRSVPRQMFEPPRVRRFRLVSSLGVKPPVPGAIKARPKQRPRLQFPRYPYPRHVPFVQQAMQPQPNVRLPLSHRQLWENHARLAWDAYRHTQWHLRRIGGLKTTAPQITIVHAKHGHRTFIRSTQ